MNNNLKDLFKFYDIPGYSKYAISITGKVLNKEQNTLLAGSRNPDGYINFRILGDNGKTLTWGRHRLMLFVFRPPENNIDTLVVNHKNGIKGDDWLDNLEWVTYKGNAEHAGSMGLTEKCLPISVRDVKTGEVIKYPSIIECARYLKMSKDAINYRVKQGEKRIFPEGKQYRLSHSEEPWYISENIKIDLLENGTSKSIDVKYVLTGEILHFEKISDFSQYSKIPASTLTLWINQPNQAVLPGYIQLKWGNDITPWRNVKDPYLELDNYTGKRTVKVINESTGEEFLYSSAIGCAKEKNISPTALNYRLKSNGNQIFADGFRYCYYSNSANK